MTVQMYPGRGRFATETVQTAKNKPPAVQKPPKNPSLAYERQIYSAEELEKEEWKPLPGYESTYEVSSIGRVKRLARKSGKGWLKEKLLASHLNMFGYVLVSINGLPVSTPRVHRLVAMAFLPNPALLPEVNHIDGNKANNCVSNLEWISPSGNRFHAYETGLRSRRVNRKKKSLSSPSDSHSNGNQ